MVPSVLTNTFAPLPVCPFGREKNFIGDCGNLGFQLITGESYVLMGGMKVGI